MGYIIWILISCAILGYCVDKKGTAWLVFPAGASLIIAVMMAIVSFAKSMFI